MEFLFMFKIKLISQQVYLIKYHEQWHGKNKPSASFQNKSGAGKQNKKYKDDFYETPDGEIKISLTKK